MHGFNDILTRIVIMLMTILLIGVAIKRLNQPYFIAYIIAGILLGPYCYGIVKETDSIATISELGLLLQMFFLGTKKEVKAVITNIRKPLYGVIAQLVLSFLFVWMLGRVQSWTIKEIVLFTFILSVSSSAISMNTLNNRTNWINRWGISLPESSCCRISFLRRCCWSLILCRLNICLYLKSWVWSWVP